jgi:lactobin A/cerein 7B family class IIb bacteriocin
MSVTHTDQIEQLVLLITAAATAVNEIAGMATWGRHTNRRRIMNVSEASDVRELTANELDEVNGGIIFIAALLGLVGAFAAWTSPTPFETAPPMGELGAIM